MKSKLLKLTQSISGQSEFWSEFRPSIAILCRNALQNSLSPKMDWVSFGKMALDGVSWSACVSAFIQFRELCRYGWTYGDANLMVDSVEPTEPGTVLDGFQIHKWEGAAILVVVRPTEK